MKLMSVDIKSHTPPSKFTLELEFNDNEDYFIFEAVTGKCGDLTPQLECYSASKSILRVKDELRFSYAESLIAANKNAIIKRLKSL